MFAACVLLTALSCPPSVEIQIDTTPTVMYYSAPRHYRSRVYYHVAPQVAYTYAYVASPPVVTYAATPVATYAPPPVTYYTPETVVIERSVRGPIRRIIRRNSW